MFVAGQYVFAPAGVACSGADAASGAYNPPLSVPPVPTSNNAGLMAVDGGSIVDSSSVTVNANAATGSYAVWSEGVSSPPTYTPSNITFSFPVQITTSGGGAFGLYASDGGAISADDGASITTSGAMSKAVYASGAGAGPGDTSTASTISITDPSINVKGTSSNGVQADNGGVVTLTNGSVTLQATDLNAQGALYATGAGSMISASGTVIETDGDDSPGAQSTNGASIALTGGSVLTKGAGSPGLAAFWTTGPATSISATGTTITTEGDAGAINQSAALVVGGAQATGTLTNDTLKTEGEGSDGVLAQAKGNVTLTGANGITTLGDNSIGLQAIGGAVIGATGLTTISTGSTTGSTGLDAYGVNADGSGSQVNLAATTITTTGQGAIGLYASDIKASGSGGAITVSGALDVNTAGASAHGAWAQSAGSTISLNGGTTGSPNTIATVGDNAIGLYAASGGVINVNGVTTISTGMVSESGTTGANAYGAQSDGVGSQVNLNGATTITTLGTSAHGLYATNGGAIGATTDTPPPVKVTTNGDGAIGVYASGLDSETSTPSTITIGGVATITTNGGVATIDNDDTTVTVPAAGVQADGGGQVTLSGGGTVTTNGAEAPGVVASGVGSTVNVSGTNLLSVKTTTDGSIGLYALGGGVINATGPVSVSTGSTTGSTGANAYGVNADGSGSQVNLAAATINTTGASAVGLYASDLTATGAGGKITVSGALNVTTGTVTGALPGAYGAWAQSAGSTIALNGASAFTINGVAFGLFASGGGAITTQTGSTLGVTINGGAGAGGIEATGAGSTVLLSGATTIGLNGASNTGLFATTGGAISTGAPTSITVSGATSTGVQATAGTVTATGTLNVTTSQASSVAFALSGAAPSIVASGGGTVSAAGAAINITSATNATATFDNFSITSASGDLIHVDPSTGTINFNSTTATANGGNLLNVTAGSDITFNANASTLTGAIQTDTATASRANVSLTNGSSWTMTGSSTMTSLTLTNSTVTFSPSGGFKTLTVGSLTAGTGANITLNTQLAGAQNTDQIVINGGATSGTTSLTIKNASAGNAGAATAGSGIPVVVVTNGGTTTTTAFKLASPVTAGGFQYTLAENPSNDDWYLTGSPVPTPENAITAASIQNSVNSLAQAQFNQMVTTRLLGSLLLGANEQINGCDCGGGFAGVGSFSLGSHGRWALSDSLTLLAGMSWDSFYQDGVNVSASPIVAAALRYDPANWGPSRPFVEFGASLAPYMPATYTRYYNNGFIPAQGVGSAIDRGLAVYGRLGWVDRITPTDEAGVYGDLVRGWQEQGGYTEVSTGVNPFPLSISNGIDREDVVRLGATYTHLFFGNLEANVNGAVAHGFDSTFGSQVSVLNFGSIAPFPILSSTWAEFGGRLGYRFSRSVVVDAFALGTLGGEVGRTLHVGLGARYAF